MSETRAGSAVGIFLRHLAAHDLPDADLFRLKAEAFEEMAVAFDRDGDEGTALACRRGAATAWMRMRAQDDAHSLHVEQAAFDPKRFTSIEEQEGWFNTLARTVAVDFDGVLHPYTEGWVGSVPADEPPMPGGAEFLAKLVDDGFRVVIFSTRCDHEDGLVGTRNWLTAHGLMGYVADVTCQKPAAVAYVDDRAVPFLGDWTDVHAGIERLTNARAHGAAK